MVLKLAQTVVTSNANRLRTSSGSNMGLLLPMNHCPPQHVHPDSPHWKSFGLRAGSQHSVSTGGVQLTNLGHLAHFVPKYMNVVGLVMQGFDSVPHSEQGSTHIIIGHIHPCHKFAAPALAPERSVQMVMNAIDTFIAVSFYGTRKNTLDRHHWPSALSRESYITT
jgi:hypothetical protein